jgi:electron transport complex protein RnfG
MPGEYKEYLERSKLQKGTLTEKQIQNIKKTYQDKDIYAITGATISSRSVTAGVRNMTKKFAYRMGKLDQVMAGQHIEVAF